MYRRPQGPGAQQPSGATFGSIIGLGGTPSDIVLDELRGRLYLVNNSANRVDIWGINENAIVGSISVGLTPLAGAISMDGAFLYVTNQASSSLSVIDLNTRSVVQNITLPAKPEGVAVGSDGRALISTQGTGTGNPPANTLLIYDRTQSSSQQLVAVQVPPPPSTPGRIDARHADNARHEIQQQADSDAGWTVHCRPHQSRADHLHVRL